MGWLEGLLTGYAGQMGDIRAEENRRAEAAAAREGKVYEALLNSPDDEIRAKAATGLLMNAQPQKRKGGFAGWMGEMEQNPIYPQLLKYMTTPKQIGEDVTTTTTTPQQAGYLPIKPTSQPAAQTSTQTTTPGAPGPETPQPLPSRPLPGSDQQAPEPPPPPPGYYGFSPSAAPTPPPGFTPGQPSPSGSPLLRTPPPGGYLIDESPFAPGAPSSGAAAAPAGAAAAPAGAPAPGAATPPPAPPQLGLDQVQQSLRSTDPESLVTHTRRPVYGLPHAFPTVGDIEMQKMRAEVGVLQQVYRDQGDPDWQKKGMDAYLSTHARGTAGVGEGDSQQVTGDRARALGVPDGTWMQPLYDRSGNITHWIPAAPKVAAGATAPLKIEDEAAMNIGLGSSRDLVQHPEKLPEYRTELNRLNTQASAAKSTGTSQGKYADELKRVNPVEAETFAQQIAGDVSKSGPLLAGRSQALKDAVFAAISRHGGNVQKMSESTRQMAETATDILPMMDKIAADAKEFERLGMLGPVKGRWQDFLTGQIGETELAGDPNDPNYKAKVALAGKFRAEVELLQRAVLRAHGGARGASSPEGLKQMDSMLSAGRMDLGTFLSGMSGFRGWMDTYANRLRPAWSGTPGVEPDQPAAQPPATQSLGGTDADLALAALHQKYTTPEMAAQIAAMEPEPVAGGPPQVPAQPAARPAAAPSTHPATGTGLFMRNGVLVHADGSPF